MKTILLTALLAVSAIPTMAQVAHMEVHGTMVMYSKPGAFLCVDPDSTWEAHLPGHRVNPKYCIKENESLRLLVIGTRLNSGQHVTAAGITIGPTPAGPGDEMDAPAPTWIELWVIPISPDGSTATDYDGWMMMSDMQD